jgi:hypothetical protein
MLLSHYELNQRRKKAFENENDTEAEFLNKMQTKVLEFSPCYSQSPLLYSTLLLRFLFL